MGTLDQARIEPVISSKGGVHISIYISNAGFRGDIERQMGVCLDQARKVLEEGGVSLAESARVLAPLRRFLKRRDFLNRINGNVALFCSDRFFHLITLKTPVSTSLYVADSFHVKPLLRSLQESQEFGALVLEEDVIHFQRVSDEMNQKVDSVVLTSGFHEMLARSDELSARDRMSLKAEMRWVREWLRSVAPDNPRLFIMGDTHSLSAFCDYLPYDNLSLPEILMRTNDEPLDRPLGVARARFKREQKDSLDGVLNQVELLLKRGKAEKKFDRIVKMALKGEVSTLVIAHDVEIFGRINTFTGEVTIHARDMDHRDDDVIDDLAQIVLSRGGSVVAVPREKIPMKRLCVGVLKSAPEPSTDALKVI